MNVKHTYIFGFSDETRQIGSLICRAIEVIDCQLENDFEQRLKYYTNCRADFKRLDSVLFRLIHMSMNLALLVRRMVNQSRAKGFMQVLNNEHTALLAGLACILQFFKIVCITMSFLNLGMHSILLHYGSFFVQCIPPAPKLPLNCTSGFPVS